MSWNLDRTRLLVKQLYGEDQLDLAENSLHSIHRRKLMARYHWQEFKLLHEKRMQRFHESAHPMIAFFDEFGRGTGAHGVATQAHLLGCLQNLHAMADTFDFAVYYLLKLGGPIDPRSTTGSLVSKALTKDPRYGTVLNASNILRKGGNFLHLDALVKLRSPAQAHLAAMQSALLSAVDVQLDGGDAAPSMVELLLSLGLARERAPDIGERLAARASRFSSSDKGNRFFLSRHYFALAKHCFGIAGNHGRSADMDCAISQAYEEEAALRISGEHRSYVVAADFYAQAAQALLAIPKSLRASRNVDEKLRALRQTQRDTAMQSIGDFVPMGGQHVDINDETASARDAVEGRELTEALLVLAEIMPLASRREAETTTRERMSKQFFSRVFSTSRIANDRRVIAKSPAAGSLDSDAQETEDAVWAKMIEGHTFRIRFTAESAIVPALHQLHFEHCISEVDLINIVGLSGTVPAERVNLVAKGLKAGFEGDFVVALHLLVPQLEHLVRIHLQHYGEKTTAPDLDGLQREAGLSTLVNLPGMETVFGVDLTFEIRALFCDRFGPNLRNELAHGLLDHGALQSAESIYAWWLIFRLIYQQYWYRE